MRSWTKNSKLTEDRRVVENVPKNNFKSLQKVDGQKINCYLIAHPGCSRRFSAHKEPPHILQVCSDLSNKAKRGGSEFCSQHQEQPSRGPFHTSLSLSSPLPLCLRPTTSDPHRPLVSQPSTDIDLQNGDRVRGVLAHGQAHCARFQQQHLPHGRECPATSTSPSFQFLSIYTPPPLLLPMTHMFLPLTNTFTLSPPL